jgi:hypothetical protein
MRRFLFFATITIILLGIIILASGAYLADNRVFSPGNFFYPLQEMAEQLQSILYQSPESLYEYRLAVAFRRLDDLTAMLGTKDEAAALEAFISALEQLSAAYSKLSPEKQQFLESARASLLSLLDRADPLMRRLSVVPKDFPTKFAEVETKLHVIRLILSNANLLPADLSEITKLTGAEPLAAPGAASGTQVTPVVTISPQMVQFLPGSKGALHAFFPLTGQHATLICESCHTTGLYRGTDPHCAACHADVIPANHYPADCALCHTSTSWKEIIFNHPAAAVTDCQSCHNRDKPANHYPGQCSACHNTNAWKPANFNHAVAGATDCQSCHADVRPVNHYQGQCSACHNTNAWTPATFNHAVAGATDCQSCHTKDRPANHYAGQCSACHDTNAWKPANFNHSAVDTSNCQSCHTPPAGHYNAQCSACHNTNAWKPASFNHAAVGATNCQGCHTSPAGHYNAQCSACHNTNAWKPASFNHAAVGATDCQSCHARPANHFQGQCSNCHSTSGWTPANFSHNFPMDHGGAGGVCAKCHPSNSSDWTCYTCHDQGIMDTHHAEKGITDIGGRCLECHPTGKNP